MMHRWSNLKNNWHNRKRIRDMFNSTCLDESFASFLAGMIIALLFQLLTGCTTLEHEKECTCDCKQAEAHFECNGIHYYKHKEIK